MTAKELINDLCKNIEFLIRSSNAGLFSEYWLLDFVTAKIEILGKLLIASDEVFVDKNLSRYTFTYAILKLNAFKDYRQFIKTYNNININRDYSRNNTNIAESELIVNNISQAQNSWNLYEMLRCKFQHQSVPNPYNNSKIVFNKNSNPRIENENLIIGCINFANSFVDACNELINMQDDIIQSYITRENFLPIYNEIINIPPITGLCQ